MLTKTIASPLSRKATLVSVTVSQWTARKLDRKVTDEVNRSHGAVEDAGRYNKLLIEKTRLEAINGCVSKVRTMHYKMTKPWCDEGLRILPNVLHAKFANEFRALKREFDTAADDFCRDYPTFVEERKRALNGLFNESDYPSADVIRDKFKLEVKTFPIPEASDFRSDVLDHDTIADIKRELEATSDNVLQGAMKDTVLKVGELVGHMAEKLKTYQTGGETKSFFKNSLVDNVRELADLLPAFNFTNDPALDRVTDRIKRELCTEDAKTLRDNEAARATVQKSAEDILKDVSDLLG
jgi:hypothetical protein